MGELEQLGIERDWTFETGQIARDFDRHVREQLPWYDLATDAVGVVVRHYLDRGGLVYDIGCSTGNIGRKIETILVDREARLVGIDSSEAMSEVYDATGEFVVARAEDYDYEPFDVAVLFLALMFVPLGRRHELINRLYDRLKPGGCIIVFDKMLPVGGYVSTVMYRLTLAGKVAAGVSSEDIIAKELSLAGVQKPTPIGCLGPNAVEWFRFGDFAGFIID